MSGRRLVSVLASLAFAFGCALGGLPPRAEAAPLTVHTIERPPFVIQRPNGTLTGFSIELWRAITAPLDIESAFIIETRFADMLKAVEEGRADAAVANISITSDRERQMDFSQPIFDSGLQILIRAEKASFSPLNALTRTGAHWFLGAALLALLGVANLIWIFERGRTDEIRRAYLPGLWDSIWWAMMAFVTGGADHRPDRPLARLLAMIWVLFGVISVSSLTATITTVLTVSQLGSDINSYRDLEGWKVGLAEGTTIERFARDNGLGFRPYADFSETLNALEAGEIDATIGDAPVVRYYALNAGAGVAVPAGPVFSPDKIGFALPTGSDLRDPVNQQLLTLIESGEYERLRLRYFGDRD